jgi:hypothetical protein
VCLLDFRDDELSISPKGGRGLAAGASLPRRDCSARNLVDLPDQTLTIAGEFDVLKLRCVPGMPMVYAATLRLDFCALAASAFEICPTRTAKSISRAA